MQADRDFDTNAPTVDLRWAGNLRPAPQPISCTPRFDSKSMQGHEHSDIPATRIPQWYNGTASAEGNDGDERNVHQPARMLKCCCGRRYCTVLEHNNIALGEVERDLETAARLGQALLTRHESYINDSQVEQNRLTTTISELEAERHSLQNANERIVAENRDLLQRLEHLNGNLTDSDQHVKRLEQLLSDCEVEVKRLNNLVRKTEDLDKKLHQMEHERQLLDHELEESRDENRSTLARWRESELKIRQLEEDLRRIEWEAHMDREKHEEIVARFEKQKQYEQEVEEVGDQSTESAALPAILSAGKSKNVVSHFVRDILQDNASLQAGIAELKQLLQLSNEEVQNLREQIVMHQPVEEDMVDAVSRSQLPLDQELHLQSTSPRKQQQQQEVHVHHHYHAKPPKIRPNTARRPSRRRIIMPGYGSISDSSTPTTPTSRSHHTISSPVIPQAKNNRWSMQSTATMSSVLSSIPSSPRSYFDRGANLFDRYERGEESSRPTSPESMADLMSPGPGQWRFRNDKRNSLLCEEVREQNETFDMSPLIESKPCFDADDLSTPADSPSLGDPQEFDRDLTPKPSIMLLPQPVNADIATSSRLEVSNVQEQEQEKKEIPETNQVEHDAIVSTAVYAEPESTSMDVDQTTPTAVEAPTNVVNSTPNVVQSMSQMDESVPADVVDQSAACTSDALLDMVIIPDTRPSLQRKGSHETLVSISGMDIHIAQRASPAATLELLNRHFAHSPSQVRKVSAAQPLASVTEYTVVSSPVSTTINQHGLRPKLNDLPSSVDILSDIATLRPKPVRASTQSGPIGRLGGWVRGRWGTAPTKAVIQRSASYGQTSSKSYSSPLSTVQEANTATPSTTNTQTIAVPSKAPNPLHDNVDPANFFAGRSPGVNQSGFIPGFRSAVMNRRTPSQVMTSVIDEEGLREGLAE